MVRLFDQLVSPHQAILLAFANGEKRDGLAGKILKGMGVRAGTSDLVLVMPHPEIWWIEVKIDWQWTRNSKTAPWRRVQKQTTQSDNQILFEERVTALGWRYIIIASMEAWQDFLVERGLVRRFQSGAISRAPLPNPQPSHPSP